MGNLIEKITSVDYPKQIIWTDNRQVRIKFGLRLPIFTASYFFITKVKQLKFSTPSSTFVFVNMDNMFW